MTVDKAKQRTNQLQKDLEVVETFLKQNMVFPQQKEAFDNFKTELLAIADSEIAFQENIIELEVFKGQ